MIAIPYDPVLPAGTFGACAEYERPSKKGELRDVQLECLASTTRDESRDLVSVI